MVYISNIKGFKDIYGIRKFEFVAKTQILFSADSRNEVCELSKNISLGIITKNVWGRG